MSRKSITYVSAGTGALIICFLLISLPSPLPLERKRSPDNLRICAANIDHSNEKAAELTDSLLQTGSDIFVILEWQGRNLALDAFRNSGYTVSLNHPEPGTHGICLISRNGLEMETALLDSPVKGPCRMPIASARLKRDTGHVALMGIHVPPPIASCKDTTLPTVEAILRWIGDGMLNEPAGAGEPGDAVIAAGDFNLHSFHKEIEHFALSGLNDTYAATNFGYGPSWSPLRWLPSLVRIDYIFASYRMEAVSSYTIRLPGSDHRGIVSDLGIQE